MFENIFFDLGNVLVDVDKSKAVEVFSKEFNTSPVELKKFMESDVESKYQSGKITTNKYIDGINTYFNLKNDITQAQLEEIWERPFSKNHRSIEILSKLANQANLFLLSNTNPIHINVIKERVNGFFDHFEDEIYSFDAGASKPDKKIFQYALTKSNTSSDNSIFIDDLKENVEAAKNIGFCAHQYKSFNKLSDFLSNKHFKL